MAYLDNAENCGVNVEALKMILASPDHDNSHKNKDDENAFWVAAMRSDDLEVYKTLAEGGVPLSHHASGENLIEILIDRERSAKIIKYCLENGQEIDQVPSDF